MNILITILLILAGIIVLLLIIALFMTKGYKTYREVTIRAPRQKVFDYIKQIKNQDNFNKWVMADPDMKKDFKGTVGFIYAWNGNKQAGEGQQEITAITEGKNIEMEIRFVRPFAGIARAEMTTESLTDDQTKVTWSTASTMKYPLNIMLPMIVKMLEKDMDTSLTTLKNLLEINKRTTLLNKVLSDGFPSKEVFVSVHDFFDGNNDDASIGVNIYPNPPSLKKFFDTLTKINMAAETDNILIRIADIEDTDWFYTDTVYVSGNYTVDEIKKIFAILKPDEVYEGMIYEKPSNIPQLKPGSNAFCVWWD